MNLEQLLAWLKSNGINVAEKVAAPGGTVLIFTGTRPFPWDGRPQWCALPLKNGQTKVAKKEIEALLRHFAHGELQIPKPATAAAASGSIVVQPVHSTTSSDLKH